MKRRSSAERRCRSDGDEHVAMNICGEWCFPHLRDGPRRSASLHVRDVSLGELRDGVTGPCDSQIWFIYSSSRAVKLNQVCFRATTLLPCCVEFLRVYVDCYLYFIAPIMTTALSIEALPCELHLCVLEQLSTRFLLTRITRLSKHWLALACELIRERAVQELDRQGVSLVVSTFTRLVFSILTSLISPVRNQHPRRSPVQSDIHTSTRPVWAV
jgi:hypothetical protein